MDYHHGNRDDCPTPRLHVLLVAEDIDGTELDAETLFEPPIRAYVTAVPAVGDALLMQKVNDPTADWWVVVAREWVNPLGGRVLVDDADVQMVTLRIRPVDSGG